MQSRGVGVSDYEGKVIHLKDKNGRKAPIRLPVARVGWEMEDKKKKLWRKRKHKGKEVTYE